MEGKRQEARGKSKKFTPGRRFFAKSEEAPAFQAGVSPAVPSAISPRLEGNPRRFLLPLLCALFLCLTGCVRYDVGVNFQHQNRGEIVQNITLGQRLTTLSQAESTKWLNSVEQRAKALGGRAKRLSEREMAVTIPFANGKELQEKFNIFFATGTSDTVKRSNADDLKLLQLDSRLTLDQKNWLLFDRQHLTLTADLRALGVLSEQGNIIVSPGSLVNIDFALNTPYGGRIVTEDGATAPEVERIGNETIWHLKPGEINKIEAIFWVPSYLGIGTVVIILLAIGTYYARYREIPGLPPARRSLSEM
jgi:hypothetical protein